VSTLSRSQANHDKASFPRDLASTERAGSGALLDSGGGLPPAHRLTQCPNCDASITTAFDAKLGIERLFEPAANKGGQFILTDGEAKWWGPVGAKWKLHKCPAHEEAFAGLAAKFANEGWYELSDADRAEYAVGE